MKKLLMLSGVAVLLASCSSEETVVNPENAGGVNGRPAMGFAFYSDNASRADLFTEEKDFGVWAVKGDSPASLPSGQSEHADNVMLNYCVGYYANGGYDAKAAGATTTETSLWFYEGLGADYSSSDDKYEPTSPSNVAQQFLKFWDGSKTYTYFVGYTPYIKGDNKTPVINMNDNEKQSIQFQEALTPNTEHSYMVAATVAENAHFLGIANTVPMKFYRLLSRIQIAFYEEVAGYEITMKDFKFAGKSENFGTAAMAYQKEGEAAPSFGHIVYSGYPKVTWDFTTDGITNVTALDKDKATIAYNDCTLGLNEYSQFFNFASPAGVIGTNLGDRTPSPTVYNVIPNTGTTINGINPAADITNTALQFVMSFELKSTDGSGETILVKNARVVVPADHVAWAANTIYTYVFKITKGVTGTTTTTDPNPEPKDPEKALWPIIFDNVIAEDMITREIREYTVNE